MILKQEAWILFIRAVNENGDWEVKPIWGRVGELVRHDVLWLDAIRKYICIEECHKELDMLSIDKYLIGNPSPEDLIKIEEKIVAITDEMLLEENFHEVGKPAKKGFRKNSMLYPGSIPDCIKHRFGQIPPEYV